MGACDAYRNADGTLVIPICFDPEPDYSAPPFVPGPPGPGMPGPPGPGAPRNENTDPGDWSPDVIDHYANESANLTQSQLDYRCNQWGGFWCPIADRRRNPPPSTSPSPSPSPSPSGAANVSLAFSGNPMMYMVPATAAERAVEAQVQRSITQRMLTAVARRIPLLGIILPEELAYGTLDPQLSIRTDTRASIARQHSASVQRLDDLTRDARIPLPKVRPVAIPSLAIEYEVPVENDVLLEPLVSASRRPGTSTRVDSETKASNREPRRTQFSDPFGLLSNVNISTPSRTRAPAKTQTRPQVKTLVESTAPIAEMFTQPQKSTTKNKREQCEKEQPKMRDRCYVVLTKQRRNPSRDTNHTWREITCQ